MKSIWFFVGITLSVMGALVVVAGVIDLVSPPQRQTILGSLHPALWWGIVMVCAGAIFLVREKKK
jgi:hypothetical protein